MGLNILDICKPTLYIHKKCFFLLIFVKCVSWLHWGHVAMWGGLWEIDAWVCYQLKSLEVTAEYLVKVSGVG